MACGLGLGMRLVQLPKLYQCLYDTQIHRNWHSYDYTQSGRQSYAHTLSLLCPILASASYLTFPEASSWRGTTADEDPAAPWRNDWTYSSMYCWTGNSVTSWADELKWLLKRGEWPNSQGSHSLENSPTSNVIGLALQMDTSNASLVTQVLMQMVPVHC